jgi:hypothetical protein
MYNMRTFESDSFKKKSSCFFIFMILFLSLSLLAQVQITEINKDKPLKGEWDFRMVKLWEIEEISSDVFASIGRILSDEQENLYVADPKRYKVFIVDKDGKLITAFGKRGEGPGEMRQIGRFFLVDDQLAFPDSRANRVHYFSKQGAYLESVIFPDNLSPRVMIDKHRLISIPWINWRDPKGKATGFIYNLKNKSKKQLFEFSTFKKGMVQKTSGSSSYSYSFSSSDITPIMVLGYSNNKIYYGINNVYEISVKDIRDLEKALVFSLERGKTKVPAGFKDKLLEHIDWPENVKKEIIRGFPDYFTYFESIFSDDHGNIYVYVTDPLKKNRQKLDIFSPGGKYIYKAEIVVEEGQEINVTHWKKDKLYLGIETEEGELKLVKYRIRLPQ